MRGERKPCDFVRENWDSSTRASARAFSQHAKMASSTDEDSRNVVVDILEFGDVSIRRRRGKRRAVGLDGVAKCADPSIGVQAKGRRARSLVPARN